MDKKNPYFAAYRDYRRLIAITSKLCQELANARDDTFSHKTVADALLRLDELLDALADCRNQTEIINYQLTKDVENGQAIKSSYAD